jgi:hypothetical protein
MQKRLIASYAKSKPADRLSFIRRLCGDNFHRFFYNKPHEHNRISEEQKLRFKERVTATADVAPEDRAGFIACLHKLIDTLVIVPFRDYCSALARCLVTLCAMTTRARHEGKSIKLLIPVNFVDERSRKKSNEWIPLLLCSMLLAATEPSSAVRAFMIEHYTDASAALGILDPERRSDLSFPDDILLFEDGNSLAELEGLVTSNDVIVFCDDASYSGTQIMQDIMRIRKGCKQIVPMIVVLPFITDRALRAVRDADAASLIYDSRIPMFGDVGTIRCSEIFEKYRESCQGLSGGYRATACFQHKVADFMSFYPHLLLGSLGEDQCTYVLDDGNKTLLSDCTDSDPIGMYEAQDEGSCLFAFYKVTMRDIDYSGYLSPPASGLGKRPR